MRGSVWWASIGPPAGSAPGKRRPVVVVSRDASNRSEIGTVIVVSITSNLRLAGAPGNVMLSASDSGLDTDSVANASQVSTIDKSRLGDEVGFLPGPVMAAIDRGLRLVLDLEAPSTNLHRVR